MIKCFCEQLQTHLRQMKTIESFNEDIKNLNKKDKIFKNQLYSSKAKRKKERRYKEELNGNFRTQK